MVLLSTAKGCSAIAFLEATRKVRDATIETGSPACDARLEIIAFENVFLPQN